MAKRGPLPQKFSTRTLRKSNTASQPNLADRKFGAAMKPANFEKHERELWEELAPELTKAGLLDALSAVLFRSMCRCYAVMCVASGELLRAGVTTTKTASGRVGVHPAMAAYQSASRNFREFSKLFGLGMPARQRTPAPPLPESDDFEQFLDKKASIVDGKTN